MSNRKNTKAAKFVTVFLVAAMIIGTYIIWFAPELIGAAFPPAEVPQPEGSATAYQALYIKYADGADRWVYPPKRLTSLAIVDPVHSIDVNNRVTKIQSHVYMNVHYDRAKTVQSWAFTATGNFKLADKYLNTLKDFGSNQINVQVNENLVNNKDVWVTGASMTDSDVMSMYDYTNYVDTYAFIVELKNVQIKLQYTDGSSETMNLMSGPDNVLVWKFVVKN